MGNPGGTPSAGRIRPNGALRFNPRLNRQPDFAGFAVAPLPDPLDAVVAEYVDAVSLGGPQSVARELAELSDAGRRVFLAYAERQTSLCVRNGSPAFLPRALLAVFLGGLDRNEREALMVMALIDDASQRLGCDLADFVADVRTTVGPATSSPLDAWLTRPVVMRAPSAMGFTASADNSGFRYRWDG